MLKDVLQKMRRGATDIDSIARDLGIGRGTLDAILEMAVRERYLEKAGTTSSCGACFLGSRCKVKPSECSNTEMYIVTPQGKKYAGF